MTKNFSNSPSNAGSAPKRGKPRQTVEPHELAGLMSEQQVNQFADSLVALYRRKKEQEAASNSAQTKPRLAGAGGLTLTAEDFPSYPELKDRKSTRLNSSHRT